MKIGNNQKGFTVVEVLFCAFVFAIGATWALAHSMKVSTIDSETWKKEAPIRIQSKINDVTVDKQTWQYAQLDNGEIAVNAFNHSFLCDQVKIAIVPINNRLVGDYVTDEMIAMSEDKQSLSIMAKKIPSSWLENRKEDIKKYCSDLNIDGSYVKYKNQDIVELIHISQIK